MRPTPTPGAAPESEDAHSIDARRSTSEMRDSLRRSITLVFWYKPNVTPIRLTASIPTFPLFALAHFPTLIADLALSPSACVDAYNEQTGHWEQHLISTVRTVRTEQVLLYRARRSLVHGLEEEQCPGLRDELRIQPEVLPRVRVDSSLRSSKRSAPPDDLDLAPERKHHVGELRRHSHSVPLPPPPKFVLDSSGGPTGYYVSHPAPIASSSKPAPPPPPATIPFHPHPPLKRWPNDYTVSEIASGFRAMDALVASSSSSSSSPSPSASAGRAGGNANGGTTQRAAFERVFGCRYVKSTVCRHRGVWKRADGALKDRFGVLGADERAMWGEFVRRVEGRPPGKASSNGLSAGRVEGSPREEAEEEEEDEEGEEGVKSLKDRNGAYDPALSSEPSP